MTRRTVRRGRARPWLEARAGWRLHGRALVFAATLVSLLATACGSGGSAAKRSPKPGLQVVVAESAWGSILKQLADNKAVVTSIITDPRADPHSYKPSAKDRRAMTSAQYVVYNGAGYDSWVQRTLTRSPSTSRKILDVGQALSTPSGGNPHQWYSPNSVSQFVSNVTIDLKSLDPKDDAFFEIQQNNFESNALARYNSLISQIRTKYSGVPVGASESIFAPMADALGLQLVTPPGFMDAVANDTSPKEADKATADQQVVGKRIKVFVYNSQHTTADAQRLLNEARAQNIPVVTVTETPSPASATFQGWQSRQLDALASALARATGA